MQSKVVELPRENIKIQKIDSKLLRANLEKVTQLFNGAKEYIYDGNVEKADQEFLKAVEVFNMNKNLYIEITQCFYEYCLKKQNNYEYFFNWLYKTISLHLDKNGSVSNMGVSQLGLANIAIKFTSRNSLIGIQEVINRMIPKIKKQCLEAPINYFIWAIIFSMLKLPILSEQYFREYESIVIFDKPCTTEEYEAIAYISGLNNNHENAGKYYHRAAELADGFDKNFDYINAAIAYSNIGKNKEALECYRECLKDVSLILDLNNPQDLRELIYHSKGLLKEGIQGELLISTGSLNLLDPLRNNIKKIIKDDTDRLKIEDKLFSSSARYCFKPYGEAFI